MVFPKRYDMASLICFKMHDCIYVHVNGFVAQESLYIQECMMYETALEQ